MAMKFNEPVLDAVVKDCLDSLLMRHKGEDFSDTSRRNCSLNIQFPYGSHRLACIERPAHSEGSSPPPILLGLALHPILRSLAARRSVSLMRVCQPGPVARKCSITSASIRSLSACLGLSDGGRPRRISLLPW